MLERLLPTPLENELQRLTIVNEMLIIEVINRLFTRKVLQYDRK